MADLFANQFNFNKTTFPMAGFNGPISDHAVSGPPDSLFGHGFSLPAHGLSTDQFIASSSLQSAPNTAYLGPALTAGAPDPQASPQESGHKKKASFEEQFMDAVQNPRGFWKAMSQKFKKQQKARMDEVSADMRKDAKKRHEKKKANAKAAGAE